MFYKAGLSTQMDYTYEVIYYTVKIKTVGNCNMQPKRKLHDSYAVLPLSPLALSSPTWKHYKKFIKSHTYLLEKFCASEKTNSKVENVHIYQHILEKNKFLEIGIPCIIHCFMKQYTVLRTAYFKYYSTWQQCKLRYTNLQK